MTDQNFNDEAAAEDNSAKIDEMNTTGSNDQVNTSSHILSIIHTHSFTAGIVILYNLPTHLLRLFPTTIQLELATFSKAHNPHKPLED